MRFVTFILTVFVCFGLNAQPLPIDCIRYFNYDTVINDLELHGIKSSYYPNLDYESILFIDTTSIKTLLRVKPELLKEKRINVIFIFHRQDKQISQEFDLKSDSIQDFFENKALLNSILDKMIGNIKKDLDNEIYLKDNRIAIFTIWGQDWVNTYRAILNENKINIKSLFCINN